MSVLPYHNILKFSEGAIDFAEFHLQRSNMDIDRQRSLEPSPDKLLIIGDIRLDNRSDLAALPGCNRQTTDEELALAAYRHWGNDCPAHFIGDFAFVIWNQLRQELFCCRDHVGVKPFFYHLDTRYFVFASDVAGVVAHPEVSAEISDLAVARFLGEGDLLDERQTFYEAIHKLPPATTLVVSPAGTREQSHISSSRNPR